MLDEVEAGCHLRDGDKRLVREKWPELDPVLGAERMGDDFVGVAVIVD